MEQLGATWTRTAKDRGSEGLWLGGREVGLWEIPVVEGYSLEQNRIESCWPLAHPRICVVWLETAYVHTHAHTSPQTQGGGGGGWLLNVPATCECISGTDLLRQFYVLPH